MACNLDTFGLSAGYPCGNAQVDPGELCDDGVNDGSYNGCTPGCMGFGPHCGDGVVSEGAELCDDGNLIDDDACSNGCGAEGCIETTMMPKLLTVNVQMALDKSGSMVTNYWDADGDPNTPNVTLWNSVHSEVSWTAEQFQDRLNLGITLFPRKNTPQGLETYACLVDAVPDAVCAPENANVIITALPPFDSTSIYGGTPTSAGMHVALQHLKSLGPALSRAVFLITDGAANCSEAWKSGDPIDELFEVYDDAIHTVVSDAWEADGIPTYVIGVDISKDNTGDDLDGAPDDIVPYDKLNELAVDGGRPLSGLDKFYNTKSAPELRTALAQVARDAMSCTVVLDDAPFFPQNTMVTVDGEMIMMVSDCSLEDGWVYDDDGIYSRIALCGAACESFKQSVAPSVYVEFSCTPRAHDSNDA
ncbi:MAG: hypothetical protein R3B09_08685 [Nannocystaceae bacterium]